jgi:hypothetical protein
VDGVTEAPDSAKSYPAKFGPGTSVVLISKSSEDPSQALLDQIRATLLDKIPVVPAEVYVFKTTTRSVAVTIAMTGGSRDDASASIISHISGLVAGQILYPVVLEGICFQAGATSVTIQSPSAPQIPSSFERIVLSGGAVTWV